MKRIFYPFALAMCCIFAAAGCASSPTQSPLASPLPVPEVREISGKIVFASNDKGNSPFQIYLLSTSRQLLKPLTAYPGRTIEPSWSPDGRRIVFVSSADNANGLDLYTMDADGGNKQKLLSRPDSYIVSPRWMPDGKEIIFYATWSHRPFQIHRIRPDGSGLVDVTDGSVNDYMPDVSPDVSRIVFVSERDGNPEIYIMNADGSNQRRLTSHPQVDWRPRWSPDGTQIAFESRRDGYYRIYTMRADGSNIQPVTPEGVVARSVTWVDRGRFIMFSFHMQADLKEQWQLGILAPGADASMLNVVYEHATDVIYSDWSPYDD